MLKHHGIAVVEPALAELDIAVDFDDLLVKMRHNLNTYWASYTRSPDSVAMLLSDEDIQWAVLGVLRQFYTFREHAIISKTGAGLYALRHTLPRWHPIIHEAIGIREGTLAPTYRSRTRRAIVARSFLHYIIARCNVE